MVLKLFGLVVFVVFFYWKLSTSTHCAIKSYGFLELCYWVQVMACRLIGARPLPEPILIYCSIGIWKNLENGIDIEICVRQVRLSCCLQMATVLFRPRWVDVVIYHIYIYKKVIKIVASRFETNCHHCYRTVKTFISMTVCGTVVSSLLTRRAFYMSLINCTVPLYFNGSPGGIRDGLSALSPAPVRQQWRYVCLCWSITWRVYRCIRNGVMEPRGKGPKWALLVV